MVRASFPNHSVDRQKHFASAPPDEAAAPQQALTPKIAHPQSPPENLVLALRQHAQNRSDQNAFVYLADGESVAATIDYAELDLRARAIAVRLTEMNLTGQRVLLAYPPGLDFIAGFYGCLYAGCTAVPIYLPHRHSRDRFLAIAADAGAAVVLSNAQGVAQHQTMTRRHNQEGQAALPLVWVATENINDKTHPWTMPDITPSSVAMLQYTSGSTSQPKGVMLSHANLISNTRAISAAFGLPSEAGVSWLPAYHDMGLIGNVLATVLAGITNILMAPSAFLQQPFAWLSAISKYRATISGGPNFAYDLCVQKVTDDQLATLDLSCWRLAFVGAEPVAPETLSRFADRFARCGFKYDAFYPCYGLAEGTLMVAGPQADSGPIVQSFDNAALSHNRVRRVSVDAVGARRMVACGLPVGDLRIEIADPQTCLPAAAGVIGEVWVSGSSIGLGYWHNSQQTRRSFDAYLTGTGDGPFLRTGDLGFMLEGQLFLTGRQDDLIIQRGRNYHPQDIEATVRHSHFLLETGQGACFCVETHQQQRLVLVQEVTRNGETDFAGVLKTVHEAVLSEHGLTLHTIILIRRGMVPKTSSGKVQRRACRRAFLSEELNIVAEYRNTAARSAGTNAGTEHPSTTDHELPPPTAGFKDAGRSVLLARVCQHALALSGTALSVVTPETPLIALGLDSLQRVEFAAMLEKSFSCRLPDTYFDQNQTLGDLVSAVEKHMTTQSKPEALECQIPPAHYEFSQFPEYGELKRYERMLNAVAENPYFRIDQGGTATTNTSCIAGSNLINFCVYDYLGMARDPQVMAAAKTAIDHYGTSAGASRLVSGQKQIHRDLEQGLARFLGTADALAFVSGHATNVTTIGHLMGPQDLIVHDVLAHNSIIQGAQLSGATRRVFAHNDSKAADALLSEVRSHYRRVLIAIEGVYSMDGDYPDLPRFIELKKKHKTLMLVDEAHSLGIMGKTGRGIGEHFDVDRSDVDLWMGTLSKALASCGGYIAGSAELIEYLAYTTPGFVYSVGMSPTSAAAALAALNVLQAQPQRVARLAELSSLFLKLAKARGLNTGSTGGTPVIPVIIGNSVKSLRLASALFARGINVQPILHPAVPECATRLRFFITTNHSEKQIRSTVNAIAHELAQLS